MRPFQERSGTKLPPWEFRQAKSDREQIKTHGGVWIVCDGGNLAHSLDIGRFDSAPCIVCIDRFAQGLREVEIQYQGDAPSIRDGTDVVIDSGYMVLCCKEAYSAQVSDRRVDLLKTAHEVTNGADCIIIRNDRGICLGLILRPPFGDGAYRITSQTNSKAQSVRVHLEAST